MSTAYEEPNGGEPSLSGRHAAPSTLVIVLAETRAHRLTFSQFRSNLLDAYQADLALCVARNERENPDNPFYRAAKYVWTCEEYEDWGDAFDRMQRADGHGGDWRSLLEVQDQWLGGVQGEGAHPGSAGILLWFRWFLKRSILDEGVVDAYERFVITRSDFVHPVPQPPLALLDPEFIWIPDGEDYGGQTDRHIVVSRRDVLQVLAVSDAIVAEPLALREAMRHRSNWNLERYLALAFDRLGLAPRIRRYPYTMYTVRPAGGHTRWREGTYCEQRDCFIKYDEELRGAELASWLVREPRDWSPRMLKRLGSLIRRDRQLRDRWPQQWAAIRRFARRTGLKRLAGWGLRAWSRSRAGEANPLLR